VIHIPKVAFFFFYKLLGDVRLDEKDAKAAAIDYITAGAETNGNSLAFALALLAENEESQRKLQVSVKVN